MDTTLKSQLIQLLAEAYSRDFEKAGHFILETLSPSTTSESCKCISPLRPTYEGMVSLIKTTLHPYDEGYTNKIGAIKVHRTLTGASLKDSKEWVEATFGV